MEVTATTHPRLFALCCSILQDNGAVNRVEPAPTVVKLPWWEPDAYLADGVLASLTEAERDTFANGEESEATAVAAAHGLEGLSAILNHWFEQGMPKK